MSVAARQRTAFAVGLRLGGGGGGDRAYHAVRALRQAGYVDGLYVSSSARLELATVVHSMGLAGRAMRYLVFRSHSRRAELWHDALFDAWVAAQLHACDLFHGYARHALLSMRRAKALGALTVLDRGMAHPQQYADMLEAERTRWGLPSACDRRRLRREMLELECADCVLVGSASALRTYAERGLPAERLVLVPYGVDAERFRPACTSPNRPFRVLFVGQVGLGKGVPYLLQAWRRLGWSGAELWLAGNVKPGESAAWQSQLDQPGVRFLGHVPRPEELYRQVDVFCLPTLSEGSALVTYEAMACGLAVLVTPEAGAPGEHERELLLCPSGDAIALADSLQRLRDDADLRSRLGHAARGLAQTYTWESYGQRLVALYRRLLSR